LRRLILLGFYRENGEHGGMQFGDPQNPFQIELTRTVRALLVINAGVFVVQLLVDLFANGWFTALFAVSPSGLRHLHLWQPVTYMFLHGGIWHILMNMLMLYLFGSEVEGVLGARRFRRLYLGCGVLAGLGWVAVTALTGHAGRCVGASGAVYGIVGAFAAMFPERRITLLLFFVLPVTLTAATMAIGMGLISVAMMIAGDGNVAHAAHLAGGVVGALCGWRLRGERIMLGVQRRDEDEEGWLEWWRRVWTFGRRPKLRLLENPTEAPTPEEVDRLLEKISAKGIKSLTSAERKALELASEAKKRG
jgi:membrane associated rhomboid family serine protease